MLKKSYPPRPLIGVGGIVFCDGKLLLERRKSAPARGKWSIPGGMVELGESPEQTVIREIKEETNLVVEEPKLVAVVNNLEFDEEGKVKYHFVILDYCVKLKGGQLNAADDAEELRWVAMDEVESFDLTKSFRAFFERKKEALHTLSTKDTVYDRTFTTI